MYNLKVKYLCAYLHEHPSLLGPVAMFTWSEQQPYVVPEHPVLDFSMEDMFILLHIYLWHK